MHGNGLRNKLVFIDMACKRFPGATLFKLSSKSFFNLNKSISTLKGNFSSLQERLAKLHTGGDKTRIRDNFLKIGVYFQTLNTKNIVEDKKYTVSSKRI